MAIGMIADQSGTEPQHTLDAKSETQLGLDIVAGHIGVAVRVQQALFGRNQQACPVYVDRAALEDHVARLVR
jgi:hypothetical protein